MPLDCFDVILGIQWLITVSPVWWDYINMKMKFQMNGRQCTLRGASNSSCKVVKGSSLTKACQQGAQLTLLQVIDPSDTDPDATVCHISPQGDNDRANDVNLQQLLVEFSDLFQVPSELPPFRQGFDHHIPIVPDTSPINQRPYKYSIV